MLMALGSLLRCLLGKSCAAENYVHKSCQHFQMSQMIATKLRTRAQLLKGDLSNSGTEMTTTKMSRPPPGLPTPPGLKLPKVSKPSRLPPGLPIPFGLQLPKLSNPSRPPPGLPLPSLGTLPAAIGEIGDAVDKLRASIVGCHREPVRRESGLDNCPYSNEHHFVQQMPHTRHEFFPKVVKSSLNQGILSHL